MYDILRIFILQCNLRNCLRVSMSKWFKKINSSKQGFTYIEVVVSLVIIGVIAAMIATAMPEAFFTGNVAQDIAKASDLAQRYLEVVKSDLSHATVYDAILEGTDPPVELTDDFTNNDYFTVETNITDLETDEIDGSDIPVLKQIDVEYSRASDGLSLIDLSTYVARPR